MREGAGPHLLLLHNLSGADATGASKESRSGSIHRCLYPPQIGLPTASGHVVSVTEPVPGDGTFSTNVARASHSTSQGCLCLNFNLVAPALIPARADPTRAGSAPGSFKYSACQHFLLEVLTGCLTVPWGSGGSAALTCGKASAFPRAGGATVSPFYCFL